MYRRFFVTRGKGQKSSRGVWKVLEKWFASISRSSLICLRNELNAMKKGIDSIDVYFQKIKQFRDKLTAISVVLDDEDLLHIAHDGLPSEYDSFSSAIRTCNDALIVEELNTLLNAEERAIKKRSGVFDATTMAMVDNYQPQGFGRGRGRNNNQGGHCNGGRGSSSSPSGGYNPNGNFNNSTFSSPYNQSQPNPSQPLVSQGLSQRLQSQICGKNGHVALDCYHRMDFAFQGKHALSKLAAMVANLSQVHMAYGWLTDTVAQIMSHLTWPTSPRNNNLQLVLKL